MAPLRHRLPVNLTLDPELVARIDAARGELPRARWIERAAEARLLPDAGALSVEWAHLARALGVSVQELLGRALVMLGAAQGRH